VLLAAATNGGGIHMMEGAYAFVQHCLFAKGNAKWGGGLSLIRNASGEPLFGARLGKWLGLLH
jgi:hypothetical protein